MKNERDEWGKVYIHDWIVVLESESEGLMSPRDFRYHFFSNTVIRARVCMSMYVEKDSFIELLIVA